MRSAIFVIGLLASSTAQAEEDAVQPESLKETRAEQAYCLAEALYWEGRNQTVKGMEAIASVILNRRDDSGFPDTVCDVVHQGPLDGSPITKHRCQFSYWCDGKSDEFPVSDNIIEIDAAEWATHVAHLAIKGDIEDETHGSTYYHAHYVSPFWNEVYTQVAVVEDHLFYTH